MGAVESSLSSSSSSISTILDQAIAILRAAVYLRLSRRGGSRWHGRALRAGGRGRSCGSARTGSRDARARIGAFSTGELGHLPVTHFLVSLLMALMHRAVLLAVVAMKIAAFGLVRLVHGGTLGMMTLMDRHEVRASLGLLLGAFALGPLGLALLLRLGLLALAVSAVRLLR